MAVVGGKPLWLMERLVEDYSRPGDLVVDPCCGAGTTLLAALRTGRRAIGGDVLREHAEIAARRVMQPQQQPLFGGAA
jgi:site-specific DNA-methyltransferase (adenine-specific)